MSEVSYKPEKPKRIRKPRPGRIKAMKDKILKDLDTQYGNAYKAGTPKPARKRNIKKGY